MSELEKICCILISNAGTAKSLCYEAIDCAKKDELERADQLIDEATQIFIHAHKEHAKLIQQDAQENNVGMTLLLVHAEDQLIAAETAKDMALQFIDLFRNYALVKK